MTSYELVYCLWDEMGLTISPAIRASAHRHHAREVIIAIDGTLDLHCETGVDLMGVKGALIDCHVTHQPVEHCHEVASLLVGPTTLPGTSLGARLAGRPMLELDRALVGILVPQLAALRRQPSIGAARRISTAIVGGVARSSPATQIDRRIVEAARLVAGTYKSCVPLSDFASAVGLSSGRFGHLFREQIGMPLRAYRRWLRLRAALSQVLAGEDLTRCAFDAGFADLPDLTRTCRKTFGVPPSRLARLDSFVAAEVEAFPISLRGRLGDTATGSSS